MSRRCRFNPTPPTKYGAETLMEMYRSCKMELTFKIIGVSGFDSHQCLVIKRGEKMKILYNPIRKKSEKIRFEIMKIMLKDIILDTSSIIEALPAIVSKSTGIFCKTEQGGKKFWTFKELSFYYAKKNGELQRIKDDNLRQLPRY